jgi:hypothetical protein
MTQNPNGPIEDVEGHRLTPSHAPDDETEETDDPDKLTPR